MKLTATALLGLSLTLTAAACGDEQEAPTTSQATSAAASPSEGADVPVVPGPKPKTKSSTTTASSESADSGEGAGESCGQAKGPDGSLRIKIVEGDLDCSTAESVAKEYSPKIATGQPQTVNGWDCGPSQTTGELSRCTKDDQAFALVP